MTAPDDRPACLATAGEEWRPVGGYEGLYEVSNHGRVYSRPRPSTSGGFLRQQARRQDGYMELALCNDGHRRMVRVHVLVMETFIGQCPSGMEIRHLNGNPADNRLSNLAYGTHSENLRDKRAHGTDHQVAKTHCPRRHPLEAPNLVRHAVVIGRRSCLACHRARAACQHAKTRGRNLDLQAEADAQYARIAPADTQERASA